MDIKLRYILLLVAGCSLCNTRTVAQANARLRVYHSTGNVLVVKPGLVENAKRGIAINRACVLRLTPSSRAMIIDSTGVYAVLDRQGVYTFDSLIGIIKQLSRIGVSSKFFQYVWVSFTEGEGKDELPNNIMAGVLRGNLPMKEPADSSVISGNNITFHWSKERLKLPYRFILRNAATKKILINTILKQELELTVSVTGASLAPGIVYEWSVDENDTKQPHNVYYRFLFTKPEDAAAVKKDHDLLSSVRFTPAEKRMINDDIFMRWVAYYKK